MAENAFLHAWRLKIVFTPEGMYESCLTEAWRREETEQFSLDVVSPMVCYETPRLNNSHPTANKKAALRAMKVTGVASVVLVAVTRLNEVRFFAFTRSASGLLRWLEFVTSASIQLTFKKYFVKLFMTKSHRSPTVTCATNHLGDYTERLVDIMLRRLGDKIYTQRTKR